MREKGIMLHICLFLFIYIYVFFFLGIVVVLEKNAMSVTRRHRTNRHRSLPTNDLIIYISYLFQKAIVLSITRTHTKRQITFLFFLIIWYYLLKLGRGIIYIGERREERKTELSKPFYLYWHTFILSLTWVNLKVGST